MPVKYHCPKCHRRFTEWGAQKVGFKCPHDEWCPKDALGEIELIRGGVIEEKPAKKTVVKRPPKKVTTPENVEFDTGEEVLVPDVEEVEEVEETSSDSDFTSSDDEESPVKFSSEDNVNLLEDEGDGESDDEDEDLDAPVDLAFGETPQHLNDDGIEELRETQHDWTE